MSNNYQNNYQFDDEVEEMEDEEYEHYDNQEPESLTKNQKMAVVGLAVFSVLIVFMWMKQFQNSISINSSSSTEITEAEEEETCTDGTCYGSEENLKNKDTDQDGLSDWEELNTYETSPYLEDSDSDGINDYEEIINEKDPNCPTGRDCYGSSLLNEEADNTETGVDDDSLLEAAELLGEESLYQYLEQDSQDLSADEEILQSMLSGQSDADMLREVLIQAGIDEDLLDQLSDEELMASYEEALAEESTD